MRWRAACLGVGLVILLPAARPMPPRPDSTRVSITTAASAAPSDSGRAAAADSSARADSSAADSLAAPAPPPRDYLAEVRANFTRENRAYAGTRVVLDLVEPAAAILLMLVLLFSGLSARLRDIAFNLGHRRYVQVLVYFTLFTAVTFVAGLPLEWYRGYALEHQYRLSNEGLGSWFADEVKAEGFTILFLGVLPLIALGYRAIEKRRRSWWLWLAAASVPVVVAASLLSPLIFEPAFNKFTPLRDPVLKQEILALAARAGIPARKVYEVDKSAQTRKYNAYVSGFGASQRIVLWDTTLQGMERDEILFVMGHEMGHYRLGHIWKGIGLYSVMSFALFFLTGQIVSRALARFGESWRIRELHDVATLPLFAIAFTIVSLVAQPMSAAFSRGVEHEADAFGLELTRSNDAGARAFLKLGSQNRDDPEPSPFIRAVLYDHPPLGERIRFALDYHPWTEGKPNRYFRP